jgi:hypothetical protein
MPRSVFLHGMWRCGSTFVWSRFRGLGQTLCFYEPLHHGLARLNPRRLQRASTQQAADLRHPAMERPYFDEYAPLLSGRGTARFRREFAFGRFSLPPSRPDPALQHYLCGLIDVALAAGRATVAGFNGSDLRIGWMKVRFNALQVALDRDPYALWCSYMDQRRRGNFTFLINWLRILDANRGDPVLAPLAEHLRHRWPKGFYLKDKARYRAMVAQLTAEETYLVVCYFWMAYALHALSFCDVLADMDRLNEPGYRNELSLRIFAGCGLDIDLSQAVTASPAPAPLVNRQAAEWTARRLFPMRAMAPMTRLERVRLRLRELSPRKAALLRLLLDMPVAANDESVVRAA